MATPAAAMAPTHSLVLRHMPSLDSLRGAAVLMVLFFHGFELYRWKLALGDAFGSLMISAIGCGRFGVNVFFVLSGFLITGILLGARERGDFYRNFYLRRALRILPVYLLVLAVLRIFHVVDFRFAVAAAFFLANFSRLFGAPMNEYGSLWSLAVEEHFYLLWPVCVRRLRERTLERLLWLVIVGEPLLRLAGAHYSAHLDIHYKTPFVLDFLAYGALLALLVRRRVVHLGNARRVGQLLLGISAGLALLEVWLAAFHNGPTVDALADLPFTWGACAVILLGLVRDHARLIETGSTASRGILPFYGYISYGLYLINVFIFAKIGLAIKQALPAPLADNLLVYTAGALLCIAVSTGLAYLSRRYFEAPLLKIKDKWQDRFAPPVPSLAQSENTFK